MDQQVAVIGQDPLRLLVAFDADRQFARLAFQLQMDLVADGLNLALVAAGADDEVVGEGGDAGEVQHANVGGFLRFGGAHGQQPGRGRGFCFAGFGEIDLGQRLYSCPYRTTGPRR